MLTPISYFVAVTGVGECIAQELEDHVADGTLGRPDRVLIPCSQLGLAFFHGPYTSQRFPVEALEDPNDKCVIGPTAVQVIVSLVRCEYHPSPTNQGKTPPTSAAQTGAALLQCVEEFYVRQAVTCCLSTMYVNGQIDDYRIGTSDRQVNGDLGEVSLRFSVQIL
jgi:hypothetical protein